MVYLQVTDSFEKMCIVSNAIIEFYRKSDTSEERDRYSFKNKVKFQKEKI